MKQLYIILIGFLLAGHLVAQDIVVHDPVMIKQDNRYYLFCTGWGIDVWSSADMKNWTKEPPVFKEAPQWTTEAVKDFKGHFWAPDIAFFNNRYYLYYSVSSFGKNTSCMGLATNTTLNPNDPEYKWVDQGKIIQSYPGKTNWNAIDPNLIIDTDGTPYLTFGSFWDGLKLVKLSSDATKVDDNLNTIPTIASRKNSSDEPNQVFNGKKPYEAGNNAIEAPFIFKKGNYYYLFASIDYCCRGENSTYKMIVGRSEDINQPFVDRQGKNLANGGGTLVLKGNADWHGVGHNSAYTMDGTDYLVFHGYDAHDNGEPKLIIREILWDTDGWPIITLNRD